MLDKSEDFKILFLDSHARPTYHFLKNKVIQKVKLTIIGMSMKKNLINININLPLLRFSSLKKTSFSSHFFLI